MFVAAPAHSSALTAGSSVSVAKAGLDGSLEGRLTDLVGKGVISGWALLHAQGVVSEVVGPLAAELLPAEDQASTGASAPGLPPSALQFLKPFLSADPLLAAGHTSFSIAGTKLVAIQQTPGYVVALSRNSSLGLALVALPQGLVLAATWPRKTFLSTAFNQLQAAVAPLLGA